MTVPTIRIVLSTEHELLCSINTIVLLYDLNELKTDHMF